MRRRENRRQCDGERGISADWIKRRLRCRERYYGVVCVGNPLMLTERIGTVESVAVG